MEEILELTVTEATAKVAAGEISSRECSEVWRGAAAGDQLNAYLWRAEDDLGEGEGPLAGIPVAVKDIFCTEGVPTTAASRILDGYLPPYTATAVRRLTEAGASVLGKTNMDEFAMGSSNRELGLQATSNPWDLERGAGRLLGRLRRRGGRRRGALGARAPTPAARSASRRRSAASSA